MQTAYKIPDFNIENLFDTSGKDKNSDKKFAEIVKKLRSINNHFSNQDELEKLWLHLDKKQASQLLPPTEQTLLGLKASTPIVNFVSQIDKGNELAKDFIIQHNLLTKNCEVYVNMLYVVSNLPTKVDENYIHFLESIKNVELPDFVKEDLVMKIEMSNTSEDDERIVSESEIFSKLKA